jgi:hypothetical protein
VDGTVDWLQQLPEHGGGAVAEHRALAAGEDRGHEASVEAQAPVADGVDALVDAVQLTSIHSISDRSRSQTSAFELPPSCYAMLPRRNPGHPSICHVAFLTHVGT